MFRQDRGRNSAKVVYKPDLFILVLCHVGVNDQGLIETMRILLSVGFSVSNQHGGLWWTCQRNRQQKNSISLPLCTFLTTQSKMWLDAGVSISKFVIRGLSTSWQVYDTCSIRNDKCGKMDVLSCCHQNINICYTRKGLGAYVGASIFYVTGT